MDASDYQDLLQNSSDLDAEAIEALAEYSNIGLFKLNLLTGEIVLNCGIAHLTGYEPGDIPHSQGSRGALIFEDDREFVNQNMAKLISGKVSRYQIEYRMRRRDGSIVSVAESAIVYQRDQDGRPTQIAGLGQDLTRLRWAEDKARLMESENRKLAQNISDNELADQNRLLRAANNAAAIIIGGMHQDYETVLRQSLQTLGKSVLANRVRIWRNTVVNAQFDFNQMLQSVIAATKTIRAQKNLPKAQEIPIIAMTANAFKEDAMTCLAAGMNQHIAKPFDINKLFGTLSGYLD